MSASLKTHGKLMGLLGGMAWVVASLAAPNSAIGQLDFEKSPIDYGSAPATDKVAQLSSAMEAGEIELEFSDKHGWLPSVLEALQISPDSQTLVFSKTSLQLHKISPRTPRALYFSDDVYIGWCQRGDVLEIAATDPKLGAVFYTMDQEPGLPPKILRDRGQCLTCHATHRTQGVPGYLVRSIFPDNNGRPRAGTRTYVTDHSIDFTKRFGGWYVSGAHGSIRHMGNAIAKDRSNPESLDRTAGANRSTVTDLCDTSKYLRPESDIVALMILEHQSQMHNLIARAGIETRIARHYDEGINEALERPEGTVSPSTKRRIAAAAQELVNYMLFVDEVPLESPVVGGERFTASFQSSDNPAARLDSKGRSLRELDLQTRMFKYPCSYLVYTDAFDALPKLMYDEVQRLVNSALLSPGGAEGFEHLSDADRVAIVEILRETKPGFLLE